MPSDNAGNYLFASSDNEMQRLRLQAQVWEREAAEFLRSLNISEGARALDLGCGAMGVLRPLSRIVGDRGEVVGLDRDAVQLAAARAFVDEAKLANVSIIEGDAFDTKLPAGSFDLVHVRFLFAPVGRDSELLAEILRLARPGGIIAIEEPDASCWNMAPPGASWSSLKAAILAAYRAVGGDFDVGCRTYGMLRDAGLRQVSQRNAVLAAVGDHPYKRILLQLAVPLRPRILERGLLSEAELDACLLDAAALIDDPGSVMTTFIVTQVAAIKAS